MIHLWIIWRLDQFLGESFLSSSLSIISGPPGSGKTQLLLSILSWCLENDKTVLYINCGCDFVLERLCSILTNHDKFSIEVLKHVVIENLHDYHELLSCFEKYESVWCSVYVMMDSYFSKNHLDAFSLITSRFFFNLFYHWIWQMEDPFFHTFFFIWDKWQSGFISQSL